MSRNSTVFRFLWCLTLAAMLVGACGSSVLAAYAVPGPEAVGGIEVLAPYEKEIEGSSVDAIRLDASAAQPTISCKSAFVVDMDSGKVIYDYNGSKAIYPASTTKIMTAYLCLKYGDLNAYVTVQPGILSDVIPDATTLSSPSMSAAPSRNLPR